MTDKEAIEIIKKHQKCIEIGNGCFDRDDLFIFERDKRCLECEYCVYDSELLLALQKGVDLLMYEAQRTEESHRRFKNIKNIPTETALFGNLLHNEIHNKQ